MGAATVYVFCASPYFTQGITTRNAGNITDGPYATRMDKECPQLPAGKERL